MKYLFFIFLFFPSFFLFAQPLTQRQLQQRSGEQNQINNQASVQVLTPANNLEDDGADSFFPDEDVIAPERLPRFLTDPINGQQIEAKTVYPKKNQTTYIRTATYLSVVIHFEDEYITKYFLGTPNFFNSQICPTNRCVIIQPKTNKVFSDLTVFTQSENTYSFFLVSDSLNSQHPPDLQVRVFRYAETQNNLDRRNASNVNARAANQIVTSALANEMFLSYQAQDLGQYLERVENLGQRELERYENQGILNKNFLISFNSKTDLNMRQKEAITIFDDNVWTYIRLWPNKDTANRHYNMLQEPIIAEILSDRTYVNLRNYERVNNYIIIKQLFRYGLFLQYSDNTNNTICIFAKDFETKEIVLKSMQRQDTNLTKNSSNKNRSNK